MGGGHFAIGAQTRPSMATFICMCCSETVALGAAAMFHHCAAASGFKKPPGFCTAARSTILTLMLLRGKPLWRVCRVPQVQCECRWPGVELYNLL